MSRPVPTRFIGYTLIVGDDHVRVVKNGRTLATLTSVQKARLYVKADRRNRKTVTA